jgi:pimeloyl-ACP methyl ester carboxylesterase
VEQPETQFVDSGGLKIAYQVFGDGPVDLVVVPGFVSNVDMQWGDPEVTRFNERLASFARVTMYDKAGTGLSDPVPAMPTLEQRMEDLRAVLDAVGADRPVLFGISEGGPLSLLFAATYPDRVRELILYGSFVTGILDADVNPGGPRWIESLTRLKNVTDRWGHGLLVDLMSPTLAGQPLVRRITGMNERASASPAMARAAWDSIANTDVRDILPTIRTPTLVLHRLGDSIPIDGARYIAAHVQGARLVELTGSDHWWWVGDADAILDAMEESVTGSRPQREADRMLATVLFTDIVGSTERAVELGDQAWRKLLVQHNELTRKQLASFRGREVASTGDGFVAVFDGPARAIRCARDLVETLAGADLPIRAGVHAGECEQIGENIGGIAVHIGARVAALAGTGEVLVTGTVRDLVAGSGIRFEDAGEHDLKGVPGAWHLYRAAAVPLPDGGAREPLSPDLVPLEHEPPALAQRAWSTAVRRAPGISRRLSRPLYRRASRRAAETA